MIESMTRRCREFFSFRFASHSKHFIGSANNLSVLSLNVSELKQTNALIIIVADASRGHLQGSKVRVNLNFV